MKNSSESHENVPERSIPRPSNLKNTSIAEIRQHMGLEGKDSDSKKNWLNHRVRHVYIHTRSRLILNI